jgi:hypothetical protein
MSGERLPTDEFRLAPRNSLDLRRPLTPDEQQRIVRAVATGDEMGLGLANRVRDLLNEYARGNGAQLPNDLSVLTGGRGYDVLRRAGFDSIIDDGSVHMLRGTGIRSAEAVFDPDMARLPNIYYGLPFVALPPLARAATDPNQDHRPGGR